MTALKEFLAEVIREIDVTLNARLPQASVEPTRLHEAIRWSVFAGGKRIRPAILIAVGWTFGAADQSLLMTAAAFEMIHTYSLIHDDLPAMDDGELRRGKATCHRQFDEATAILAGDVLQTLAFKTIADDESLSAQIRLKLISILANASGTPDGMVAGQQLDLDAEGEPLSIDALEQIHRQKTGALITAAAEAGATIGGASDREISAVVEFAAKLGLLFQITDDLLDVTQSTETLGKTAGKDVLAEKATYPGHYGVEKTRALAEAIRKEANEALVAIQKDTSRLREFSDMIADRST